MEWPETCSIAESDALFICAADGTTQLDGGSNAEVHRATLRGVIVAAKRFHILERPQAYGLTSGSTLERVKDEIVREVHALAELGEHDHVVGFRCVVTGSCIINHMRVEGLPKWLCMEYCSGGSLHRHIYPDGESNVIALTIVEVARILREAAMGLAFIHEHDFIHRDIKPKNIMIADHGVVKIGDLGLARVVRDIGSVMSQPLSLCGTPVYNAPEVNETRDGAATKYGPPRDMYAFGITAMEMVLRTPPKRTHTLRLEQVERACEMQPRLEGIIKRCTWADPARRATAAQMVTAIARLVPEAVPDIGGAAASKRSATTDFDPNEPPKDFCCPITFEVMVDPVVDREGNSYERAAIERWLVGHLNSPSTRQPLRVSDLAPNRSLRSLIEAWSVKKEAVLRVREDEERARASAAAAFASDAAAAASEEMMRKHVEAARLRAATPLGLPPHGLPPHADQGLLDDINAFFASGTEHNATLRTAGCLELKPRGDASIDRVSAEHAALAELTGATRQRLARAVEQANTALSSTKQAYERALENADTSVKAVQLLRANFKSAKTAAAAAQDTAQRNDDAVAALETNLARFPIEANALVKRLEAKLAQHTEDKRRALDILRAIMKECNNARSKALRDERDDDAEGAVAASAKLKEAIGIIETDRDGAIAGSSASRESVVIGVRHFLGVLVERHVTSSGGIRLPATVVNRAVGALSDAFNACYFADTLPIGQVRRLADLSYAAEIDCAKRQREATAQKRAEAEALKLSELSARREEARAAENQRLEELDLESRQKEEEKRRAVCRGATIFAPFALVEVIIIAISLVSIITALRGATPWLFGTISDTGLYDLGSSSCFEFVDSAPGEGVFTAEEMQTDVCGGAFVLQKNDAGCIRRTPEDCSLSKNCDASCIFTVVAMNGATFTVDGRSVDPTTRPVSEANTDAESIDKVRLIQYPFHRRRVHVPDIYSHFMVYIDMDVDSDFEICATVNKKICTLDSKKFCSAEATWLLVDGLVWMGAGIAVLIVGAGIWKYGKVGIFGFAILIPQHLFSIAWALFGWTVFSLYSDLWPLGTREAGARTGLDPASPCGVMHTWVQIVAWPEFIWALGGWIVAIPFLWIVGYFLSRWMQRDRATATAGTTAMAGGGINPLRARQVAVLHRPRVAVTL